MSSSNSPAASPGGFPEKTSGSFSLVLAANACMFMFGVVLLLMGSLLPSLDVNYAQAGSLGSFPLAGILAATVLIGPVLDTLGPKPVLAIALALVAGSLALMPALKSYPALACAALVYGLGGGALNTSTSALVADLSASGRGAALNVLGFSFSLGALTAPLLMSTLGERLGTTSILRLLAAASALILVVVSMLRFPPAAYAGARIRELLNVLNNPLVWIFGALLFFESGSENSLFVWAAKIVGGMFHTTPARASWALVGLSAAIGGGRLVAARLLRRLGNRTTILLSTAVTIAGCIVMFTCTKFMVAIVGMTTLGLGLAAIFPTALGVAGDRFPGRTGTVFGAIMTVALVGGTAGPSLSGAIASRGIEEILWVPVVCAVAVAGLTLVVTGGKKKMG